MMRLYICKIQITINRYIYTYKKYIYILLNSIVQRPTPQMQTQQTLQKKQQYLRTHIQPEKYDDFYEFCENVLGSVDINAWTMLQTIQNVNKFNEYFQKKIQKILVKYSYGEYQSRQGQNTNQHNAEESEMSECVSSRVVKSSAVEFLDQILQEQNYTSTKTQPKNTNNSTSNFNTNINKVANTPSVARSQTQQKPTGPQTNYNTNIGVNLPTTNTNPTTKPPQTKNTPAVSFDQFDFWTSSIISNSSTNPTPTPAPKISNEIRNKSSSEYKTNKVPTQINSSPQPMSKNTYNNASMSQYFDINLNLPEVNNNRPRGQIQMPVNQPKVVTPVSQQNSFSSQFDFFTTGTLNIPTTITTNTTTNPNKNSPYLKKQYNQTYDLNKNQQNVSSSGIRLKQVRQLKESTSQRGVSVNIDNKHKFDPSEPRFETTVQCYKQAVRNSLADRSFNVYFDKHEIVQRKFLASDYAMYNIKVVPLNIEIKRNYQDYTRLKSTLQKMYPGVQLPYLEQQAWISSTSDTYIANQKKMLEFFTRDLLRNKQIRNSVVLEDFLTLRDHKAIKRKFEKYLQIQPLKGLQDLCFLDGKVNVTIFTQQKKYIQNLEVFLSKMNQFYSRHQKLTQSLIQQHTQLMRTYKFVIGLLQQQENYIKQFNSKTTINNIKFLGNSAKIIKQTYKQELSCIKFDYEIEMKKIMPYLKYERNNFMELQKLIDVQKKLQRSYDKRSLSEKVAYGQAYNSQSVKGTKTGILTESSNLTVLKHQVGYLGYQTRQEGQRIFDELAVKNIARWQSLGEMYLNKLTNSIDFWKNVTKVEKEKYQTQLTF